MVNPKAQHASTSSAPQTGTTIVRAPLSLCTELSSLASVTHTQPGHAVAQVAVQFDGGVVLGADTRVTTGTYISNRTSDKITPLSDNAYLCRSGSAADTQAVSDIVRHFVHQHSMEIGGPPDVRTVATLAMQARTAQLLFFFVLHKVRSTIQTKAPTADKAYQQR